MPTDEVALRTEVDRICMLCRIADVASTHTHALLGIFHRSSMAAVIADSTVSFRYVGKPNAEYALVTVSVYGSWGASISVSSVRPVTLRGGRSGTRGSC